jgi:hypothetical protein
MGEKLSIGDAPALSLIEFKKIEQTETEYFASLDYQEGRGNLKEYARTYALEFFNLFNAFYAPKRNGSDARQLAKLQAVVRAMRPLEEKYSYTWRNYGQNEHKAYLSLVESALDERIRELASKDPLPHIKMSAPASPAFPSVFASEPSPLLRLVQAMSLPSPLSSSRRAFVQPLLDARGMSVPEWAAKAKVSRHTAQDYLDAKRKTNHSNRKLLAEALGVSFHEFPK